MKYKEQLIYDGNLRGWACEDKPYKFKLGSQPIKNGFVEVVIDMPDTPLVEKKSGAGEKLHIISGWEVAKFSQSNQAYHKLGKADFVLRVGKYEPAKIKIQNDNKIKLVDNHVKKPDNFGGENTFRIQWLNNVTTYYFNGKLMIIDGGKSEFKVGASFAIKYILLGMCGKYRNPSLDIIFYDYKIGEYIEDDGDINPDSPDDNWDDQNDNQDSEEIIKPEKKDPISFKETWERLKGKSKWALLILLGLFLIRGFFC